LFENAIEEFFDEIVNPLQIKFFVREDQISIYFLGAKTLKEVTI